jgi:hypothetical protein
MEFRVPPAAPRNACPSGLDTIIRSIHTADFANLEAGLRCIVLVYNDAQSQLCTRWYPARMLDELQKCL